jgi:hypothetical protein
MRSEIFIQGQNQNIGGYKASWGKRKTDNNKCFYKVSNSEEIGISNMTFIRKKKLKQQIFLQSKQFRRSWNIKDGLYIKNQPSKHQNLFSQFQF